MNNTLESNKIFPIVAWITVISFALLTYVLTTNLNDAFAELDQKTTSLEAQLNADGGGE